MDEAQLIDGLRARREDAVATFLERYKALLYHCIAHFEADQTIREDLYQDLVLFVLERLDREAYDATKGTFSTWLYRVAWCRCVDQKRRDGARGRPKVSTVGDDVPERADDTPGPDELAGTAEVGGVVREALTELSDEERSLLDLRFVQGETISDIAAALSISIEQTKYRLRRATISLRRVLLNHFAMEQTVAE
ncbi:MAG: sigma-70 family RNA polymerase sigma factor [Planctomycetota bacterium]